MRFMYLLKSNTTAALHAEPARPVPPPRETIGAPKLCPQIPEGDIHRGNRHGGDASSPEISHGADHQIPEQAGLERALPDHHIAQQVPDQCRGRCVGVCIPDAGLAAGIDFHQDQGGRVPLEGAVRLRPVGGHPVGIHTHAADRASL
jgi:hypothetical protein